MNSQKQNWRWKLKVCIITATKKQILTNQNAKYFGENMIAEWKDHIYPFKLLKKSYISHSLKLYPVQILVSCFPFLFMGHFSDQNNSMRSFKTCQRLSFVVVISPSMSPFRSPAVRYSKTFWWCLSSSLNSDHQQSLRQVPLWCWNKTSLSIKRTGP